MSRRLCTDCGATELDAAFPPRVRGQPIPTRCRDCLAAMERGEAPRPRTPARTRASARAAYRSRLKSAQLDLVDLLVKPP
jgi:hypothetical protein